MRRCYQYTEEEERRAHAKTRPRAKELGLGIPGEMCWNLEKEKPLKDFKEKAIKEKDN